MIQCQYPNCTGRATTRCVLGCNRLLCNTDIGVTPYDGINGPNGGFNSWYWSVDSSLDQELRSAFRTPGLPSRETIAALWRKLPMDACKHCRAQWLATVSEPLLAEYRRQQARELRTIEETPIRHAHEHANAQYVRANWREITNELRRRNRPARQTTRSLPFSSTQPLWLVLSREERGPTTTHFDMEWGSWHTCNYYVDQHNSWYQVPASAPNVRAGTGTSSPAGFEIWDQLTELALRYGLISPYRPGKS